MAYLSLYRKYRSQTFADLIGQDHVVRTLQNGIASSRIAHSYLFTGPRGTGKTSTARLLAKALCCENGPSAEPDNTCEICRSITAGACVDVIEMDAASESGVDDIREQIVEAVEYRPMLCRYKVFIIDEVHDLSSKAFDALLKTIEEPPEHIIFILATTEYNKVPPTIRSRCQKYEFHRASMQDLAIQLNHVASQEGVTVEPQAVSAIARMADGGYRDALTLLEQAILTSDGLITLQHVYDQLGLVSEELVDELLMAMHEADVPRIMDRLGEVARLGRDPRALLESMLYRLADLTRASFQVEAGPDSSRDASLHETAARIGRERVLQLRGQLAEAHKTIRDISLPRVWLESEMIRLAIGREIPPAAAPVAARPKPPSPKQTVAAVTPPAAVSEPVRPAASVESPAPRVTASVDPNDPLAAAKTVWSSVLAALPEGQAITKKVVESEVTGLEGNELIVSLNRQMDVEWFSDNPKRSAYIHDQVRKNGGEGWVVRFQVTKRSRILTDEPVAVELPAEGPELEQLTRKVFGA